MSTINLHQTTSLTPEQYIAGLTDFGPGRSKLFGNSADDYLKVHQLSRTQADVTEGSGGVWESLHYDWSDPNHVVLTTTDSNVWGGTSGHTYNFSRQLDGTTDIDVATRCGRPRANNAAGCTKPPTSSTNCRRASSRRPSDHCRKSGWPRRARTPRPRSTPSSQPMS